MEWKSARQRGREKTRRGKAALVDCPSPHLARSSARTAFATQRTSHFSARWNRLNANQRWHSFDSNERQTGPSIVWCPGEPGSQTASVPICIDLRQRRRVDGPRHQPRPSNEDSELLPRLERVLLTRNLVYSPKEIIQLMYLFCWEWVVLLMTFQLWLLHHHHHQYQRATLWANDGTLAPSAKRCIARALRCNTRQRMRLAGRHWCPRHHHQCFCTARSERRYLLDSAASVCQNWHVQRDKAKTGQPHTYTLSQHHHRY